MSQGRFHRAVSQDGTKIVGPVEGSGPPLVLVHGGLGDGEVSFRFMLPFLVEHFTCFMPSTRGRGRSQDHADHSRQRHFEDIAAFIQSIGEPVFVFGHSMGAVFVMGAAAMVAPTVRGMALYEAAVPVEGWTSSTEAETEILTAMTEGRMVDALRIALSRAIRVNDDELEFFLNPPALDVALRNLPTAMRDSGALAEPIEEIAFDRLTMPTLLIGGSRSGPHFKQATAIVGERIRHARVVEIAGAGHVGPAMSPERVAQELIRFAAESHPPALAISVTDRENVTET